MIIFNKIYTIMFILLLIIFSDMMSYSTDSNTIIYDGHIFICASGHVYKSYGNSNFDKKCYPLEGVKVSIWDNRKEH